MAVPSQHRYTKLGVIVASLHILFALLVVICLCLIFFGGNSEPTIFEGKSVSTWHFIEAIVLICLVGWFLCIPIVIFDVLYAAKHLLPGNRKRIPVIMSTAFFGFFAVFFCIAFVIANIR